MAIQVFEQLEEQEFKGAASARRRASVDSQKFVSQIVGLQSNVADIDRETQKFIADLCQLASDRLSTLSFPTTKDEEWKYTDVSNLGSLSFTNQPALSNDVEALLAKHLAPKLID